MATAFDDLPDLASSASNPFDDLPELAPQLPIAQEQEIAPEIPGGSVLIKEPRKVGIDPEVAGIAGANVPRMPADAMLRAREEVQNDLALAGVGLQQGFHALGEQGWSLVQGAQEPILSVGPLSVTGSGLVLPTKEARKAADLSREIALEGRRRSEELQPVAEELVREGASPISQTIGQGIPSLAPALATGPLGRLAPIIASGVQQGASTLSEAQSVYDVDPETTNDGIVIPNGAFRRALLPAVADAATTAAITFVSGKLFGEGVEGATIPARRELIKNRVNEVVKGAIGEGLEESAQQFVSDYVIGKLSYKPNVTLEQAVSDALKAGVAGGLLGGTVTGLRFASDVDNPQKALSEELARRFRESVDEAQTDEGAIDQIARERLTPPRAPVPEGTRVETGPGVRRVVAPQAPTGNAFEALPDAPQGKPSFNVSEATPLLKNNVGRKFRTADGGIGELKIDEAGRFVLDDGSKIIELPVGPEGTAGEAGIEMLKSNYAPSKLQVSREQAAIRRLANWARRFPQPPPVAAPPPAQPGQPAPKVEMPQPHPSHVGLINAVTKVIQSKNPTQGEYLGAISAIPQTKRIIEGLVGRMEAAGAKPDQTRFYYAVLERMEDFENRYLEGITRPAAKDKTVPKTPETVPQTAESVPSVKTPESEDYVSAFDKYNDLVAKIRGKGLDAKGIQETAFEIESIKNKWFGGKTPTIERVREKQTADAKEFKQLFADWGIRLGFIQDPNLFFHGREPGGDTASVAHNIRYAKAKKQAYDSVIKYFGGDPQDKTHANFARLLPKFKAYIEEFNQADEDLTGVPEDVSTEFLPPEKPMGPDMETARRIVEMSPDEFLTQAKDFNKWNIELGKKATSEDVAELKQLREKAQDRLKQAFAAVEKERTPETLRNLGILGSMPQFYSEAIAEYERKNAAAAPKLRPGEKKTGDLFQGEDQPFNLAGQTGTDGDRVAREKAEAEQRAREAAEAAKKAQMNLPVEPQGDQKKLVSDDLAKKLEEKIKARLNKPKDQPPQGPSDIQASGEGPMLGAESPTPPKKAKLDPETFSDAVELGVNYIQSGYHKYPDFAKQMLEVFGPEIQDHIRSIYEQARVTVELPGSQSVRGRSPGLQPGLKPPEERIIVARAEHTPKFDEEIIPEELRKHLDPHQRQGAAAALSSLEEQGGFLNADGTGTGKTRQALTVAHFYAKQGYKVIIVTKAETIKPNWAKDTFGGSYKADATAMGVNLVLARDGFVRPGKIGITTYQNLDSVKDNTNKGVILIFDEAHALKNDSQQASLANQAIGKSHKVMFMTATPGDKAEHIYYLAPIGIMEGKSQEDQLKSLGMKVRTVEVDEQDENGHWHKVKRVKWSVDKKVPRAERRKRFNELFERMTQQGRIIKREISLDGVDIKRFDLAMPPEAKQLQHDILDKALEVWEKGSWAELSGLQRAIVLGHQRRQLEPYKIGAAVTLAKRELEAGRQVVLFISRINESEVGFNRKVKNPFGGDSIKERVVLMSSEGTAKSLREALHEQGIHDIAEIHGNSEQGSLDAMKDFQDGKKRVVIATIESGGTGINLDDTIGNRPRTMIMVTAPYDAVGNIQAAGRIWRLKTLSASNMYYLLGDVPVDTWNYGIIGEKMKQLGAVVEGQTGKLNIDDTGEVDIEDFNLDDTPPVVEGGEFPELEWKSRVMGQGTVKYVAEATDEFWDWWNANGRTQNPYGLTINKRGENDWIVWSNTPIPAGQGTGVPPVIEEAGESGDLEGISGTTSGLGATTTPSPITTSTLPPKSQREIITDIAKALDIPIRFGRLVTRRAGGYFRPVSRYITSRKADDIPVVAHEAGHALDFDFKIRQLPQLNAELMKLGDPAAYPGSRSSMTPSKTKDYQLGEGWAEFMRYWFTNPTFAKQEAPLTWAHFEGLLAANEDLGNLLRKAQSDIQVWLRSPSEARFRSQVSRDEDPLLQPYTLSHLTRDMVDRLHYFRLATETAKENLEEGQTLDPSKDIYLLARNLSGTSGMAKTFIRNGTVDFRTKEVTLGDSLEDALKPVAGRITDFGDWILSVRARELQQKGIETGFLPQDVKAVYDRHKDDPAFQAAFANVKKWQDKLLKYAQDSGLLSATTAMEIRAMNQDYVPYHRVFEVGAGEASASGALGSGPGMNVTRPSSLRGIKGSSRQVIDPLESMVKNAAALIHASEKAAINQALADYANLPGMGEWIRVVDAPKEKVQADLKRIRRSLAAAMTQGLTPQEKLDLQDAIANLEKLPDELILAFWRQAMFDRGGPKMNIIRVVRDGSPKYYQLKKELYESFNALDIEEISRAIRIIGQPAQWLRAGTVLETGFAIANIFKDQFSSAIINRHGLLPFQAMFRGVNAMIRNPKLVAEWAAAGGELATEADFYDRTRMQKFLSEKITKDLTPAEKALIWIKSPLAAMRFLTAAGEEATRIGEFKTAYDDLVKQGMPPGEARRLAAFESRDRQDFAKGGAQTKILRYITPFWNAGLQANVRFAQSLKTRPFRTSLQGVLYLTLPKLLEMALSWDDEDYWNRPQWERDAFFLIPIGKSESGHTRFLRLPNVHLPGLIFATIPGRIVGGIRNKDKKALDGVMKQLLQETIPNPIPPGLALAYELNAGEQGWNFWMQRHIVPDRLARLPAPEQWTEQSTETAKLAGKALGVSPMKVDHAIAKSFGGLGRVATGEQAPARRFVAPPLEVTNKPTDDFYEALKSEEKKHASAKSKNEDLPVDPVLQQLRRFDSEMSDLRRAIRRANTDAEKVRLRKNLFDTTKRAADWYAKQNR